MVPVLVLLTVFVLWAGRGGRAALTADLAAEEAVTAAALCCEEDTAGAGGREALVEDMLDARPGLGFLCIGGPRPNAGDGSGGFLSERWVEFEPGREVGGVGVLGVRFLCESDGAVAPLRGVFPTVTFHGQAAEVVQREPSPSTGFTATRFPVTEEPDPEPLVFTVSVHPTLGEVVTLTYKLDLDDTTAEPEDFGVSEGVSEFEALDAFGLDGADLVGTVVIAAGEDSAEIVLPLVDDGFFEGDEELVLELTGADPPGVVLDDDRIRAAGVIIDADPQPHLFIAGPDPLEEVEGGRRTSLTLVTAGTLTFQVRLRDETGTIEAPSATAVFVDVRIEDISTAGSDDYTPADPAASMWSGGSTTLRFDPGVVAIDVVVQTVDDYVGEETETFRLVLENEAGAPLGSTAEAVGTIIDDEVRVSVANVSAREGDASTPGTLQFQVVLDRAPNADLSLRYELVDPDPGLLLDTAQRGTPPCVLDVDDYLDVDPAPATLIITWPRDDPLVAVDLPDVTICGDSVVEPDETLWLSMWVPTGGEAVMEDDGGAFGTILNDDTPVIIVDDETASEAPAGGMLVFAVRVEVDGSAAVLDEDVTVQYDIVGHSGTDSATAVDDFRAPSPGTLSDTLTFAAGGDTEIAVPVELLADYLPENTETFRLVLSNPSANAELFDRDPNNSIDEPYAVGTITDDAPPVLSVSGFRGPEDSTQSFTVELNMAPRTGETVMVDYAITGGTGTGQAAVPGSARPDFCVECDPDVPEDGLSGTLIFPGGTAPRTVGVRLLPDTAPEDPETLTIALSDARNAYLDSAAATATGTIDDIAGPYLFVGNTSAREGVPLMFTVALCNPVRGQEVTVKYKTVERTALAGLAFVAVHGTLTFPADMLPQEVSEEVSEEEECGAGVTADAKLLPVQVTTFRDGVEESDQEVHLVLSGHTPAASVSLDKSIGVGRIINVSAATVRVNDPTADEGDPLVFTVSLVDNDGNPAVTTEDVTVFYETADRTATAGADYTPVPATPGPCLTDTAAPAGCPFVTFAPNSLVDPSPARTHDVEVLTRTDTEDEDDETVALVLSLAAGTVNAGLGDAEGIGTIFDVTPGLRIADVTAVEGEPLVFRVSLVDDDGGLTSTSEVVSFTVSTEDGTATDGDDYTAVTDWRLVIPVGGSGVDFVVETLGDDRLDSPETVRAVLSAPTGASTDRGVAIGTITEACITIDGGDDPGAIVLYDVEFFEDSGQVLVEASLSRPLCEDTPPEFQSFDGTATSGRDYAGVAGVQQLFLSAISTVHRRFDLIGIGLINDRLDEDDETFTVEVNWASSLPAKFRGKPPGVAVVTIIDDDPLPGLSVADASADEGEAMTFEVTLIPASGRTVTVQYRTTDDSAVAGTDYTSVGWTTIEFEPGPFSGETPTSATFTVQTHADADDVDETFWVELRALDPADPDFVPVNAQIDDGVAVGTILEGDLPEMRISDASGYEGEDLAFVVELSEAASQPVTVSYETVSRPAGPRSATAGVDYTPPAAGASLTFGVGDPLTQTVYVAARDDGVEPEADETFLVELSGVVGASLADPSAVGTINGDLSCIDAEDPGADPPGWTPADPISAPEDAGPMIVSFELDMPYCQSTSFRYVTNGSQSTATNGVDYEHRNRRASVEGLQAVVSFEVPLIDDDINEDDETIIGQVRELGLNPVKIDGDFFLTGTIIDDDSEVAVSVNDVDTDEGDYLTFTVRLDRPSDRAVTVAYATESGPVPSAAAAAAAADYTPADSTVTIPAGELSAPVRVRTLQDLLDEADETVGLRLRNPQIGWSPPQAAVFAPGGDLGVGTITDDDVPPSLRVSDASVDEGGALVFVVTLDAPSGREVSVPVATRDGPARSADDDYVGLASSVVVFAPGVTRQTVSVQTLADDVVESAEIVWLDLGTPANATIGDDTGRGVIRDVSDRRLSVSDADVVEGGTLAFEVGFAEGPSSRDVTVRYRTRSGTAAAGDDYDDDYESAPRELRIVAGDTSATVSVPTMPDTLNEDNESLELVLSDPQGAVIVAGSASGTIIDDDPLPELRVSNTEASEGVGASAVFTLSLGEASGRDVTVAYSTADLTADAGDDYIAVSDGEVVIDAGDRQATVDVALVDDDVAEEVETFRLVVSSAVNASRGDSVGVATVTDDDGLVQILVDDPAAVHEGDGASAVFTVRLSHAHPTEAVTVVYSTADGTAIAGDDYTNTSDTLTFAAGRMDETVSVPLINDDDAEEAETFRLVLSSPGSNAELGDGEATVLIRDDDGLPTVSVADAATRTEGATATFTVTLSRAVPREVTVDYATRADPTAAAETAAVPGQDYTAASGTVTFAARATEATVTVPLLGDALDEHTETFWLRLASPVGATIVDDTATGTIADDDPLPEITITDAGATEGTPLSFEVRLTPFSGRTVTVPWTTEARPPGAGAASPGSDYTAASGTLTLAPGTTTARVEVATLPDDVSEADETFLVHLGTPANAALDDSTAVGAIRDDDGVPRVFIADTTVNEDDGPAIFTVTLSHPSSQPVTVKYNTADGTAEDPDDYAPDLERTLTIPATFTGGEISVFIADDDEGEGTETFTITLTDPVNAVIAEGAGTAVGYIVDDEGQPRLTVSDAEECEDGSSTADCEVRICRIIFPRPIEELSACAAMLLLPGACQPGMCTGDGTLEFSVQLSHASSEETSVRYTIFERGAVDPRDYVASSGTLRIPAGDVSAAIPVVLVDDAIDEEEVETFLLRLDDPVGVELVVAEAVGTILDDDLPPRVAAEPFDAFSNENDGFAYHRVTLSDPSDLTATMDYVFEAVDDRSEFAGIDPTPGTLTFAPGVVQQTIEVPLIDNSVATFAHGDGVSWRHATTRYRLNLNNRVNARTGIDTSLGVVWDDEMSAYVESVAAQDILEGAGAATFTIALNRFSDTAVTATYQTVDGTAAAGIDYTAAEATVTFPPGTITATVTVAIIDDTDIENDESFTLRIIDDARNSNLTYLAQPLSDGHGTGFGSVLIIDDDSMPEVSVAGTRANEDAGTMTLWVSLSRGSATAVTVDFATADGTATAGSDYTATNGTLTIPAGATGAGVSVTILDDTDDTESDETFTLNLSNAAGATIADADATATIIEDANLPTLTMGDVSQTENIVLESPFIGFRPRIDSQATRTITVDWQVVEVPSLGDEAATIGADFLASPSSGTFTILPRPTIQRPVPFFRIVPDVIPERDERFQVILSNPRGARLGNTRVWGTIRNDDVPIVSVADVEASESDGAVVFTLRLHEPGLDPASLRYTTMVRPSEGDRAASPGDDYTTAWGTLNIPAGDTTATIAVPILADSVDEADETFLLVLTNPDTLEFRDSTAVGTITDDDPGWVIDDRSVREDAGSMVFRVQRDHTSPADVAVEYRFGSGGSAVGGADCAVDGVDFVWPSGTSATGTVTMPAAGTEAAVSVEVCNDDDPEGRENLLIELTNVIGRKLTGVGTIVDDD